VSINKIVIRSHGGLGNQLFQLFYGNLISQRNKHAAIIIVHDSSYSHKFSLAPELTEYETFGKYNAIRLLVLSRIFKILEKVKINSGVLTIHNTKFMDGYFQNPELYQDFDEKEIEFALNVLRKKFSIKNEKNIETLEHIRMADFFKNEAQRIEYLKERLKRVSNGSHILSTDDDLLNNIEIQKILKEKQCVTIDSLNKTASEIIEIMAKARSIISNDSTLAFWAAVLSNSDYVCQRKDLKKLYKKFLNY